MLSTAYVRDVVYRATAEATRYSLPRRLAAWLHLNGQNAAWFHDQFNEELRSPIFNAVMNELRDIENGLTVVTPELARLAKGCCVFQESEHDT